MRPHRCHHQLTLVDRFIAEAMLLLIHHGQQHVQLAPLYHLDQLPHGALVHQDSDPRKCLLKLRQDKAEHDLRKGGLDPDAYHPPAHTGKTAHLRVQFPLDPLDLPYLLNIILPCLGQHKPLAHTVEQLHLKLSLPGLDKFT